MGELLQGVECWMEGKQSGINTMMGGDFNARTGEKGAGIELERVGERRKRRKRKGKEDRKTRR